MYATYSKVVLSVGREGEVEKVMSKERQWRRPRWEAVMADVRSERVQCQQC